MVGIGDVFALMGVARVIGTVFVFDLHDASCFSKGAFPLYIFAQFEHL